MADALLSPAVGMTFWAAALSAIGFASRKLKGSLDEKLIPLMGVLGSFIFAAQMVNFTIPGTGSSGHLGGGMLLAIMLGPSAAFITLASVLTVQAFFFADGGLLALGCNIWNLGVYPCFVAYPLVYRSLTAGGVSARKVVLGSVAGAVIGLELGAFSVALQTTVSGLSELSFISFIMMMLPIHAAVGLIEGFVTAGVVQYVRSVQPAVLTDAFSPQPYRFPMKKVILVFLCLTVVTGALLSWFASTHPDGLEWSVESLLGKSALNRAESGLAGSLKKLQDSIAVLPEYGFRQKDSFHGEGTNPSWPAPDAGTSLSGLIGSVIVLCLVIIVGRGIRALRRKKTHLRTCTEGKKD